MIIILHIMTKQKLSSISKQEIKNESRHDRGLKISPAAVTVCNVLSVIYMHIIQRNNYGHHYISRVHVLVYVTCNPCMVILIQSCLNLHLI